MDEVVTLQKDSQNRISITKLGFEEDTIRAEPLPDGDGWVLRGVRMVTEAELEILSDPRQSSLIDAAMRNIEAGKTVKRHRRST